MHLPPSAPDQSPRLGLSDFIGTWRLERRIDDKLAGAVLHLTGEAVLSPEADGLIYNEQGELRLAGGQMVRSSRSYRWRSEGGRIAVTFEDGRPFHQFDPAAQTAEAQHWCDPDDYAVRYDLADWPRWQTRWRVLGPRKDYVMTSRYVRL